jgi:meso-butanediol dehydrogenase/(S,S)-butanediol dehydrogenase/diacetyl reductase
MQLRGKVAVVTGAARGLGRVVALRLARDGASVVVADISADGVEDTARAVKAAGGSAVAVPTDVSDPDQATALMDRAVSAFGRLDVLVNAAGVVHVDPLLDYPPQAWDRVLNVNVKGLFYCLQAAARVMKERGGGKIINVTSPASRQPVPFAVAYAASKAAVDSITRSAAAELARHGITVNCVAPGRMPTAMIEQIESRLAEMTGRPAAELREERLPPLGRMCDPEDVAAAIAWLASSESDYMTGGRMNVTGGLELD